MRTKQHYVLENPLPEQPDLVKIEDMLFGSTALLVAFQSDGVATYQFDHRDDKEGIRLGTVGNWIQLTICGEGMHELGGDYTGLDLIGDAWVRPLRPGERLVTVTEAVPEPAKEKHIEELMPETLKADGIVILGLLASLRPWVVKSETGQSLDCGELGDTINPFLGSLTIDGMDGLISRFKARVEEGPMVRPESPPPPKKEPEPTREVRCVVACQGCDGPTLYNVTVAGITQEAFDNGEHYDRAKEDAEESDYEEPFVVFDEEDGPEWLFRHFYGKGEDLTTKVHEIDELCRKLLHDLPHMHAQGQITGTAKADIHARVQTIRRTLDTI